MQERTETSCLSSCMNERNMRGGKCNGAPRGFAPMTPAAGFWEPAPNQYYFWFFLGLGGNTICPPNLPSNNTNPDMTMASAK